jgi:hypothetical protein
MSTALQDHDIVKVRDHRRDRGAPRSASADTTPDRQTTTTQGRTTSIASAPDHEVLARQRLDSCYLKRGLGVGLTAVTPRSAGGRGGRGARARYQPADGGLTRSPAAGPIQLCWWCEHQETDRCASEGDQHGLHSPQQRSPAPAPGRRWRGRVHRAHGSYSQGVGAPGGGAGGGADPAGIQSRHHWDQRQQFPHPHQHPRCGQASPWVPAGARSVHPGRGPAWHGGRRAARHRPD